MHIKNLIAAARAALGRRGPAVPEYPLETEEQLGRLHGSAPVDSHLDWLLGNVRVGDETFAQLYRRCLRETGTVVTPFNVFQRFQTRFDLVQYLLSTLAVPGARAECGVYRGATALLLCHAWRTQQPGFDGRDFYLIDSYAGTSASTRHDLIPVRADDGGTRMESCLPVARTDTSAGLVRSFFGGFPGVEICEGWIPQVFGTLPERTWAYVHLDLSLYEPTRDALTYFYPRLAPGGVILCDGSIFCPGVEQAWREFCAQHAIPYVVLGHRELVIVK
jgi:O-methyltransferase